MTMNFSSRSPAFASAKGKKKGFTLTEIAIVLGIVGLILGAVWAAAKNVYGNVTSAKAAEIGSILIANVRGTYGTSQPASGDLSGSFSNTTFPATAAPVNAQVLGAAVKGAGGVLIPGFVLAFSQTNGYRTGSDATGAQLCNGLMQAGTALTGAEAADTYANVESIPQPATCTVNGQTLVCPTQAGYVGSICSGTVAVPGTCSYSSAAICTKGNQGYNGAVFIPWTPS